MRIALAACVLGCTLGTVHGQAITLLDAVSGAPNPNGAPTRTMTIYSNRGVPKGALAVVTASWSCPALNAAIKDNLGSKYRVLSGPTVIGPIRVQHWYAVTGMTAPEYLAPQVTLSDTCSAGTQAFNALYVQMGIFTGADAREPIDMKSVTTGSGERSGIALFSAPPTEPELMVVITVTSGVGAPFTLPKGWTGWLVGEAVAGNAFLQQAREAQKVVMTAANSTYWSGVVFGIRGRPNGGRKNLGEQGRR